MAKKLPLLVVSAVLSVFLLSMPVSGNGGASTDSALQETGVRYLSGGSRDWPQLQGDAERTGRSPVSLSPPYRARWIWLGPDQVLRNRDSHPTWQDDLTSRNGHSHAMPARVGHTIAHSVQPIVSQRRLFFGTQEGHAFALSADDGSTLWSASMPGGTNATAATDGSTVVFTSMPGRVYGFSSSTGTLLWTHEARKAITSAPAIANGLVFFADHSGTVYALESGTGTLRWQTKLTAPILGGLAVAEDRVFVGTEDMMFHALDARSGKTLASREGRAFDSPIPWSRMDLSGYRLLPHQQLEANTSWKK